MPGVFENISNLGVAFDHEIHPADGLIHDVKGSPNSAPGQTWPTAILASALPHAIRNRVVPSHLGCKIVLSFRRGLVLETSTAKLAHFAISSNHHVTVSLAALVFDNHRRLVSMALW